MYIGVVLVSYIRVKGIHIMGYKKQLSNPTDLFEISVGLDMNYFDSN